MALKGLNDYGYRIMEVYIKRETFSNHLLDTEK